MFHIVYIYTSIFTPQFAKHKFPCLNYTKNKYTNSLLEMLEQFDIESSIFIRHIMPKYMAPSFHCNHILIFVSSYEKDLKIWPSIDFFWVIFQVFSCSSFGKYSVILWAIMEKFSQSWTYNNCERVVANSSIENDRFSDLTWQILLIEPAAKFQYFLHWKAEYACINRPLIGHELRGEFMERKRRQILVKNMRHATSFRLRENDERNCIYFSHTLTNNLFAD